MNPGPRIFLSSTQADLREFRAAAEHVCRRIGLEVVEMEEFGPNPATAAEVCREKVRSAELFLGLYAYRYGFQPDGYAGKSLIELEYEWAVEAGSAVLLFLVDEDVVWLPRQMDVGDSQRRMESFKQALRKVHVVAPLSTPDRLREDLFVHLPQFARAVSEPVAAPILQLPVPPEPYVPHTYTLLETSQVIGRERELGLLDEWANAATSTAHSPRLLCVVAIGGMGKSALTWKWFSEQAPSLRAPPAGRMWWSFYEHDAGFDRFVAETLAYVTRRPVHAVIASLSALERERALLAHLDREPFLLVLDGFERLLIAYAGIDFAHLADDELDERTANRVLGARDLPEAARGTFIGQHRLRRTIDPRHGNFLRKLAAVKTSRILLTTRLYPSELQTETGRELPGCAALFLGGLGPEDAENLWRGMGVQGDSSRLQRLFATFERYPLLLRALAGEVARFRPAPGDFDAWQKANPDFDPYSLPLIQVKSHVLHHSLREVDPDPIALLELISAFRAPVDYGTLVALFSARAWRAERLDRALSELEDRGLLGWNRRTNQYDLHPIVRGVVWQRVGQQQRAEVLGTLRTHFEAIPTPDRARLRLSDMQPAIQVFNALVGLRHFEEAEKIYFDRIHGQAGFNFTDEGSESLNSAMLESLFPNGLEQPPVPPTPGVLWQLGHSYDSSGRVADGLAFHLRAVDIERQKRDIVGQHLLVRGLLACGQLRRAETEANATVDPVLPDEFSIERWAQCSATLGRLKEAVERLQLLPRGEYFDPDEMLSRILLWDESNAREVERRASASLEHDRFHYFPRRSFVTVSLARAKLLLSDYAEAETLLNEVLTEARAKSVVFSELDARLGLAELYLHQGDLVRAREVLSDLWYPAERGPYRLVLADAFNLLAEIERAAANFPAAIVAANQAYEQAYCDGPPFAYHWALSRAERLLKELGAPVPGRTLK